MSLHGVSRQERWQVERRITSPTHLEQHYNLYTEAPELQQAMIADNPFKIARTPETLEALILAEPKTEYDQRYQALDRPAQLESLYEQIDVTADMTVRVSQYIEHNLRTLWDKTDEQLWDELSEVAFGTTNCAEINRTYSQKQRRGFRLGIAHFIHDRGIIRQYRDRFQASPVECIQQLFNYTPQGDCTVHFTPAGIVIEASMEDYDQLHSRKDAFSMESAGFVKNHLAEHITLNGLVMVLNRGSADQPRTAEMIDRTRRHEALHVLFNRHFKDRENLNETIRWVEKATWTIEEYRQCRRRNLSDFFSKAQDEVIAYGINQEYWVPDTGLGIEIASVEKTLRSYNRAFRAHLTATEQAQINGENIKAVGELYVTMRDMQWVVSALKQLREYGQNRTVSEDKLRALLQNCSSPRNFYHIVERYLGLTKTQLRELIPHTIKHIAGDIASAVHTCTETERQLQRYERFGEIQAFYESLPRWKRAVANILDRLARENNYVDVPRLPEERAQKIEAMQAERSQAADRTVVLLDAASRQLSFDFIDPLLQLIETSALHFLPQELQRNISALARQILLKHAYVYDNQLHSSLRDRLQAQGIQLDAIFEVAKP